MAAMSVTFGLSFMKTGFCVAALTARGLAAALAGKLAQADESLRPALKPLLEETKKPRARRPAVREI